MKHDGLYKKMKSRLEGEVKKVILDEPIYADEQGMYKINTLLKDMMKKGSFGDVELDTTAGTIKVNSSVGDSGDVVLSPSYNIGYNPNNAVTETIRLNEPDKDDCPSSISASGLSGLGLSRIPTYLSGGYAYDTLSYERSPICGDVVSIPREMIIDYDSVSYNMDDGEFRKQIVLTVDSRMLDVYDNGYKLNGYTTRHASQEVQIDPINKTDFSLNERLLMINCIQTAYREGLWELPDGVDNLEDAITAILKKLGVESPNLDGLFSIE